MGIFTIVKNHFHVFDEIFILCSALSFKIFLKLWEGYMTLKKAKPLKIWAIKFVSANGTSSIDTTSLSHDKSFLLAVARMRLKSFTQKVVQVEVKEVKQKR